MGYHGKFEKQNYDGFGFTVNVNPRLASGEGVDSFEVKAFDLSDDSDVSAIVLDTPSEASGVVTIWVKDGVDPSQYNIRLRGVGDGSPASQFEGDFKMTITEIGTKP